MARGFILFDDYAHHPSEIQATLQGLRERYPKNALICVFQPHHTHRLGVLFDDFKKAFGKADKTILLPVYKVAGREKIFSKKYTSKFLSKFVKNSIYIGKPEKDLISAIKASVSLFKSPVTVVMMGAGNIIKYSQMLLTKYK